jgi:hypothetical protein
MLFRFFVLFAINIQSTFLFSVDSINIEPYENYVLKLNYDKVLGVERTNCFYFFEENCQDFVLFRGSVAQILFMSDTTVYRDTLELKSVCFFAISINDLANVQLSSNSNIFGASNSTDSNYLVITRKINRTNEQFIKDHQISHFGLIECIAKKGTKKLPKPFQNIISESSCK